jgi:YHS domain-containing protein
MKALHWTITALLALGACASEPPPDHVVAEPQAQMAPAAVPAAAAEPPVAAAHHPAQPAEAAAPDQGATAGLKQVEPSLVCMVNNQFMGRPQIPISVEGKTYFGCCEMCKGKLATDPSSRAAIDPVTGAAVDKASAVIAMDGTGAVKYFESEATMARYAAR